LVLLVGLCLTPTAALVLLPHDGPVEAKLYETGTPYGCRYHIMATTVESPDWIREYWYWELKRGSSLQGISAWAHREGGAVRMGVQFTMPNSVVRLPCL
jgi:hypothetical protein